MRSGCSPVVPTTAEPIMPPEAFFLVPIAGMATGTIFMFGIYKLITRWMEYRHRRDLPGATDDELQELRGRVAELDDLHGRVGELEERLDFAERLLAQSRHERAALGPGGA